MHFCFGHARPEEPQDFPTPAPESLSAAFEDSGTGDYDLDAVRMNFKKWDLLKWRSKQWADYKYLDANDQVYPVFF